LFTGLGEDYPCRRVGSTAGLFQAVIIASVSGSRHELLSVHNEHQANGWIEIKTRTKQKVLFMFSFGYVIIRQLKCTGRWQMDDNKQKALAAALGQIEKQFGKGSVMRLGDAGVDNSIGVISTGSLSLDIALGIGGLPRGRVIEVYGPESSGKTTLALQVIAECQKTGGAAAFVDAEHALDPTYAEKLGVNLDDLLVSQPDTGEQALEITDMLVRSAAVDVVVVDSVAALTPKAEIEGDMGDSHMGLQARLMSQALRKLTGNIKRSNTMVIFINQIRMKIGVMFGSPETTTGGNALKFYASVRLDIRRIGAIKRGDEVIGNETRVKVVKNKVAPPFKQCEFEILYGEGSSREGELIDLGVKNGMVEKAGAWYSYKEERIGQGKDNVRTFLKEHPEMADDLDKRLRLELLPKAKAKGDKTSDSEATDSNPEVKPELVEIP
jgi:recombination protein RecA